MHGSLNRIEVRTFRAVFRMPNLGGRKPKAKKVSRQYRNPVFLAREWQALLDSGSCLSKAELAKELGVSRPRVCQVLGILKLHSDVLEMIGSLGDPMPKRIITERRLRALIHLPPREQKKCLGEHLKIRLGS